MKKFATIIFLLFFAVFTAVCDETGGGAEGPGGGSGTTGDGTSVSDSDTGAADDDEDPIMGNSTNTISAQEQETRNELIGEFSGFIGSSNGTQYKDSSTESGVESSSNDIAADAGNINNTGDNKDYPGNDNYTNAQKKETASSKAEKTGDPVSIVTGEYSQEETPFTFKKDFSITSKYKSRNPVTGSMGKGWCFSGDQRIITGIDPFYEEQYEKQKERVAYAKGNVEKFETAILTSYRIPSIERGEEVLKIHIQEMEDLIVRGDSALQAARNYELRTRSTGAVEAVEKAIEGNKKVLENITTSLNNFPLRIERLNELKDKLKTEEDFLAELEETKAQNERIMTKNKTVFPGTPEYWLCSGLGTYTFIDEDGLPLCFINTGINTWTPKDKNDMRFKTLRQNSQGDIVIEELNGRRRIFNSQGFLINIIDLNSQWIRYFRDSSNKITYIKTSFNEEIKVSYSGDFISSFTNARDDSHIMKYCYEGNLLTQVTDSTGAVTILQYDSNGVLKRLIHPDGSFVDIVSEEHNSGQNRYVTKTINENGVSENFYFDTGNRHTVYTDHEGNISEYWYDSDFRTIQKKDMYGRNISYSYDSKGNLRETNINGAVTRFSYNESGLQTGTYFTDGSSESYSYDEYGNLTSHTDRDGITTSISRDSSGNITSVSKGNKELLKQTLNEKGLVTERIFFYKDRKVILYSYDSYGNISEKIEDGKVYSYAYDKRNRITEKKKDGQTVYKAIYKNNETEEVFDGKIKLKKKYDCRKNAVCEIYEDLITGIITTRHYEYDFRHNPVSLTLEQDGVREKIWKKEWTDEDLLKSLVLYDGEDEIITEYEYKSQILYSETKWKKSEPDKKIRREIEQTYTNGNKLKKVFTDALGNKIRASYDKDGRLFDFTNEAGESFSREYTAAGRLLSETGEYGGQIIYEYDDSGFLIESETDTTQKNEDTSLSFEYDGYGRPVKITDGEGNTKTCSYDMRGRISEITDPYGNKTYFQYNSLGSITLITYPDGTFDKREYDVNDCLVKQSDILGVLYTAEYDAKGNCLNEHYRTKPCMSYEYDEKGNLISESRNGIQQKYDYSDYNRNIVYTDAAGNSIRIQKDEFGRTVSETNRLGLQRFFAYDSKGTMISSSDYDGKTTYYETSADGLVSQTVFADGNRNIITRDINGNVIKASNNWGTTLYTYTEKGFLETQTDCETQEKICYSYDKAGRLTSLKGAGRDLRYAYGKNDEVLEVRDMENRLSVKFKYDLMMREKERDYGNGVLQKKAYDKAGRLQAVWEVNTSGTVFRAEAYVYNKEGRICGTINHKGMITLYEYNQTGEITRVLYPATSDRLNSAKKEAVEAGFTPDSSITGGLNYYLSSGEIQAFKKSMEAVFPVFNFTTLQILMEEKYTYDNSGNRIKKETPFLTLEYTYDEENRIKEICANNKNIVKYQHNSNGNLLSEISENKSVFYTYSDDNRMNGCWKTEDGYTEICLYYYDALGRRLVTVKNDDTIFRCVYQGFSFDLLKESPVHPNGLFTDSKKSFIDMAEKQTTGERYRFLSSSDSDSTLLNINSSVSNNVSSFPLYINGTIMGQKYGTETEYFGTDIPGSVKSITDEWGKLKETFDYDLFGSVTGDVLPSYGYSGKPLDSMNRLYNYGFRDYSPALARFTTLDPYHDGYNWFSYTRGDPVNFVDLWGLMTGDSYYKVTYLASEIIDPAEIQIIVTLTQEKNENGARKGTMEVFYNYAEDIELGILGPKVLEVPVVSGNKNDPPCPEGDYNNLKQERTITSSNETLRDDDHGGPENIMIRLPGTDGCAIHQGNKSSDNRKAYSEGCVAVTSEPGGQSTENNYKDFRNAITVYGNHDPSEVNVNVHVTQR